ncbi:1549_t:CDS:1, partial [Dentiscutata erythropus]
IDKEPTINYNNQDIYEDYSAPKANSYSKSIYANFISLYPDHEWIILWILKFQRRCCLTKTATNSLIKFIKLILIEIYNDEERFRLFPKTLDK